MMNNAAYGSLSRAQLSYEYLHTNSTTHEFLFGALAELVDNARDANATRLSIFTLYDETLRGGYMLCFLDDGEGMDASETADIITFGRSSKRSLDDHLIGMYGNGLKSGSMRIGNDLIVFTKKSGIMTCLFISRTFHEEESIDEVIVPIPSFEAGTQKPVGKGGDEKYALEMDVILRYSPFHTEEDFFAQFDRIDGDSGTLVIVYNMKLLDSGDPELDILTDSTDILLANPASDFDSDEGLMPEKRSFRAYTAILYMDPRMKVYIQGQKVRTKKLASGLYKPKLYKYASNRFKSRAEGDAKKAQDEARAAEMRAKEAQSKAKALENKSGSLSKDQRSELRKAQQYAAELKREAELKKEHANRKVKALKDPKSLNLIFGINIENRGFDGVFVYNCSRLIKMYEKVGPQTDGGVYCSGVIGIVDVPYVVLEPTHNKQDFADAKEFRHLMKAMGEHMVQYWKDLNIAQQGVLKFWENFGYVSQKWKDSPSDDSKYVRKRAMQLNITLQCDACLKWRSLPFSSNNIGKDFSEDWTCSQNPDSQHNKCTTAEQKMNIPEGALKKENKTQDQKAKDLEEEIRKKQDQLKKMHKNRVVTSSRELQENDRKREADDRRKKEIEDQRKRDEEETRRKEMEDKRREREREEKQRQKEEEKRKKKEAEEKQRKKELAEKQKKKDQLEKQRKKEQEERERQKKREADERQKKKEAEEKAKKKAAEEKKVARNARAASPVSTHKSNSRAAVNNKEAVKRRAGVSASTQADDDEDEDSEIEAPVKRSRGINSVDSETVSSGRRVRTARMVKADQKAVSPEKKKNGATHEDWSAEEMDHAASTEDDMDVAPSEDDTNLSASEADTHGDIGTKVEAYVNNKWYCGAVVKVNSKEGKWKVKFDYNSKDKYDKWFDKTSSNVRLLKSDKLESPNQAPPSPASISSHDTAAEAPTSSTSGTQGPMEPQVMEEITNGYRTCLRYFLPPQWIMDKDSISAMSVQELSAFPLDDFFDHYEKGLRKLVNNFQTEASLRKQEAEMANTKLSSVRKMIAKLLTSSNEEFNIDPDCDGEQVDQFLEACLQASGTNKTATETPDP